MVSMGICVTLLTITILVLAVNADKEDDVYKPKRMEKPKDDGKWRDKSVLDYNDVDLEKLYDQWEVSVQCAFTLPSWPFVIG